MTRRPLGWLPLVVVVLVVTAAAWLGVSMQPSPSATMAQIMAATRAAGTARFSGTISSKGSGRFSNSSSTAIGVIDFRHDAEQETDTDSGWETTSTDSGPQKTSLQRQTSRLIEIGDESYQSPSPFGGSGWGESRQPRSLSQGFPGMIDPLLQTKDIRLIPVRQTSLHGTPVNVYRLTPSGRSCEPLKSSFDAEVWVDGQSRLVQAQTRLSFHFPPVKLKVPKTLTLPSSSNLPKSFVQTFEQNVNKNVFDIAPTTLVVTVRLFDFGAPVAITPPKHMAPPPASISSQSITGTSSVIKTLQPGRCRK